MEDNKVYTQSHILKIDGSVVDKPFSTDNISFNYFKYLDENGELYFCEQYVDGVLKNVIVTNKVFKKKLDKRFKDLGLNKLGIGHILFAYMFLPCLILLLAFSSVVCIMLAIFEDFFVTLPFMSSVAILFFTSVFFFISLVRKNINYCFFLHAFFLLFVFTNLLFDLEKYVEHSAGFNSFFIIIGLILYRCMFVYYRNRHNRFTGESYFIDHLFRILFIIICLAPYAAFCVSYVYSVYHMFQSSVLYGLFGAFFPVLSQIIFLISTGYDTAYAFSLYFAFIMYCISFILQRKFVDYIPK